ncbi:MAG TPA: hypothetical protein VGF67_25930 [Ktedonobacteraceae bacterium]|jgi:hypothetical protein
MEGKGRFGKQRGESGYSWLYRAATPRGSLRVLVVLLVIGLAAGFLAWYVRSGNDASPDSPIGMLYASTGTLLLLFALVLYSLQRRSHRHRKLGGLRASLGWHMCLALMALALLAMHSFGELNLRSGTYALYGMLALVISGLIGRTLDRIIPRLMASEVHQALTAQGDDRIENISQKLQAIVVHNSQSIRGFAAPDEKPGNSLVPLAPQRAMTWRDRSLHSPWDLAYISLEPSPQELSREHSQFLPSTEKKSTLLRPGGLISDTQEEISELVGVREAMRRELFYRYITRYWRRFHVLLALTTLGLLIWHIVYALQLALMTTTR